MMCLQIAPGSEFTTTAWVYRTLAPNAPLDPNSAAVATALYNGLIGAAPILYWYADYPTYCVSTAVPTCTVIVGTRNPDGTITQNASQAALQPSFNAVPVPYPNSMVVQNGSDHEGVIYRPATHEMWEGWLWVKTGFKTTDSLGSSVDEWSITWGGYEPNMTTNPGWWSNYQGAVAAGIPIQAFSISVADIQRQNINHAVGMVIPQVIASTLFRSPAQRTDGLVPDAPVQEGMIFRLPANIDLSLYPATQWDGVSYKSIWRLMAEAIRDHGLVIYDKAANAVMVGEAGATPQYPTNPYQTDPACQAAIGWNTAGDYSYYPFTDFPWNQLQLLAPL